MNGVEKGSIGKILFPLKAFLLNEGGGVNAFPNIKKAPENDPWEGDNQGL
jgi:hypothetical protein